MPRLKGISFETAIVARYLRQESSAEEMLIEMYLAGISARRVEDIAQALWGIGRYLQATISELNKKANVHFYREVARKAKDSVEGTLTYCDFP